MSEADHREWSGGGGFGGRRTQGPARGSDIVPGTEEHRSVGHRLARPTVGPGRRLLLSVTLLLFAFLAVSGMSLSVARLVGWLAGSPALGPRGLWLFLGHLVAGVIVIPPLAAFVLGHWWTARLHPNRTAVRRGLWLVMAAVGIVLTGLGLVQIEGLPELQSESIGRSLTLAVHGGLPLLALFGYLWHRQAGPAINWRAGGLSAAIATSAVVGCLLWIDRPDGGTETGSEEHSVAALAEQDSGGLFWPSAVRTADGRFMAAASLMNDQYCLRCHQDAYQSWFHSAHHFSSFNNPAYLASVRETRAVLEKRDGSPQAVRWCGGCHDPVPLLSGRLDDPAFDDLHDPTAHAGITCTVCHAVTDVHTRSGNAGYTLAEPQQYPFATSESDLLQWINGQLIRAKPDFHRESFLKPIHRTAEFCGSCHKVSIPPELNHYKDFLRGQNHYDSFLLSGVSGHGARSFYYPRQASENCNVCHMPPRASDDPAARDFMGTGLVAVHDHLFPGANTALPTMLTARAGAGDEAEGFAAAARAHADFLRGTPPDRADRKLRIDIFGLKPGGRTDDRLVAPLRPERPAIEPGQTYLVEVVVRTLALGHHFTQGTADSNEVWVEFTAADDEGMFAASGLMAGSGDQGMVDPAGYRLNAVVVDRQGRRIDRRNVQDIFTAAANHEIPPGAAEVIHYRITVPPDLVGPLTLAARVRYRKFDSGYQDFIRSTTQASTAADWPPLPVVDLCEDRITLPVAGDDPGVGEGQRSPIDPAWQRWNDYGIGCLLEGDFQGTKGELRQAEEAFRQVVRIPEAAGHGWINLARVYLEEGRLAEAGAAVNAAAAATPAAPWWHLAWFGGLVAAENATTPADLDRAIHDFESILAPSNQPRSRGFDFSRDYVVRNRLADTLFKRALGAADDARRSLLEEAAAHYARVVDADPENLVAHYGLAQCHARLAAGAAGSLAAEADAIAAEPFTPNGRRLRRLADLLALVRATNQGAVPTKESHGDLAAIHRGMHGLLRPDEQAVAAAVSTLRARDPHVDRAAEAVPIYPVEAVSGSARGADPGPGERGQAAGPSGMGGPRS